MKAWSSKEETRTAVDLEGGDRGKGIEILEKKEMVRAGKDKQEKQGMGEEDVV